MVEAYKHHRHAGMLERWLSHHGMPLPPKDYFSDTGFVVDNVAIGFLFLTNSGIAMMDNFAADPKCPAKRKQKALDSLVEAILDLAAKRGKKVVTGLGNMFPTRRLMERNGFQKHGEYTYYFKEVA